MAKRIFKCIELSNFRLLSYFSYLVTNLAEDRVKKIIDKLDEKQTHAEQVLDQRSSQQNCAQQCRSEFGKMIRCFTHLTHLDFTNRSFERFVR